MGSFCASTIFIILCLAPELKDTACAEGVYLTYWAGCCFSAALTGKAAVTLPCTSFSRACLVSSVVCVFKAGERNR